MIKKINSKKAFTLIELSISITIISLLVGSIVALKNVRDNAYLQMIMSDANTLSNAFVSFKSKYLQIPGDMYNASSKFSSSGLTSSGITIINGDNNGTINNNSSEQVAALQHLALASIIWGEYSGTWSVNASFPSYMASKVNKGSDGYYFGSTTSIAGGTFSVFDKNTNSSNQNLIVYAKIFDANSNAIITTAEATYAILTPYEMSKIDSKYDDAIPNTGAVIAANGSDVAGGCINTTTTPYSYNVTNTNGCYMALIIDR
jgi:prepilin-type N-terminal cleavage/methylation domain-containing protein